MREAQLRCQGSRATSQHHCAALTLARAIAVESRRLDTQDSGYMLDLAHNSRLDLDICNMRKV